MLNAGELREFLQDKHSSVTQSADDGRWRRLWNTSEVLDQLQKLLTELFQAFTYQLLAAVLAVRRGPCMHVFYHHLLCCPVFR